MPVLTSPHCINIICLSVHGCACKSHVFSQIYDVPACSFDIFPIRDARSVFDMNFVFGKRQETDGQLRTSAVLV